MQLKEIYTDYTHNARPDPIITRITQGLAPLWELLSLEDCDTGAVVDHVVGGGCASEI